ncbi:MAG: proline--tRNA ligase [Amedibacillus dolichus]|uniref:proline--tRNA ligase n=1 Tax=Amedibacillus dolichus TaxID=31971 RepID=UPI000D7AF201|nr:proline--tRNA ligase [Amedibacillus dolichus]MCB5372057.1 proline--tRNA ligase [Amedibacillus dolichus]MCG4878862.1 proline--tRNA ligase [Amedibacillus dolichus]PWL67051.1 MAG: proline--tRNA ligase [Amedibacillus dolichus]
MKLSNSYFYTMRENAKDEDSVSGNLLVRAGMIKKSSAGIYMIMPMGKRVLKKIEDIVREEMDAAGAQELLMPALIPEEVYEISGRRDAFGSNMFALKDRYQKNYVLGPTHEELFTLAAMMKGRSYKDFPYNLYQIQTKFRDETRPRYGLIRTREFIMKDAYSFDIDNEHLHESYMKMFDAYKKIFDRCDLNYKIVKADTGAMGGSLSEEFQAICDVGEDVVVTCEHCGFSSNLEITEVVDRAEECQEALKTMEIVETPNAKTIEEVAKFFDKSCDDFVKTLIYNVDGKIYAFLLKGTRELNETKVLKLLQANEMELASFEEVERITHAKVGFAGPIGIDCPIIMDREVSYMKNFIVGANKSDHHIVNVNLQDFEVEMCADIAQVHEGDVCPVCGAPLSFCKGIEVGNTFKLGNKYAKALGLEYLDANNTLHPVEMGCYGLGLERTLASIVEQHHDDDGIIWPLSVAPYQVAIVIVSMKDEEQVRIANELYETLKAEGYDVLLDDRKERPGVKFKDMELIGIPYRITVGRGIAQGNVELRARGAHENEEVAIENVVTYLQNKLQ